jgi:hypothetical protein
VLVSDHYSLNPVVSLKIWPSPAPKCCRETYIKKAKPSSVLVMKSSHIDQVTAQHHQETTGNYQHLNGSELSRVGPKGAILAKMVKKP